MAEWSLLTNHANVLLCVTREPDIRLRELAVEVGISERAVKRIVADLEKSGYIARERHGRRNHYNVNVQAPRHPGPPGERAPQRRPPGDRLGSLTFRPRPGTGAAPHASSFR
jgi:hypothetical protein